MRAENLLILFTVLISLILFCIFYVDYLNSRSEVEEELKQHKLEGEIQASDVVREKYLLSYERNETERS